MKKFTKKDLTMKLGLDEEKAKLIMKAQNEFPELLENECEGFVIDGRVLFHKMKISNDDKHFNRWMVNNLENTDMKKDKDYTIAFKGDAQDNKYTQEEIEKMTPQKRSALKISTEYSLTLECAKEIAMVTGATPRMNKETKELSKLIRKYFIYLEEAIKDINSWMVIREPEKQGHKEMCAIIDKQYQNTHDGKKPNSFIYSTNSDMLNLALFGYKSKAMKTILDVNWNDSLRDNLTSTANKVLFELQQLNSNLLLSNLDFKTRKMIIENTCKERYLDIRINVISEFHDEIEKIKNEK